MEGDATRCPECGGASVNGKNCWEQLGEIAVWEWNDPELMREHFLTVASYNLQHPAQFTDEAMSGLTASFIEHLDQGTPVSIIRKRTARTARGVKVLRPAALRTPRFRAWPLTIASVYVPNAPEGAAARVRAWAASVRRELDSKTS